MERAVKWQPKPEIDASCADISYSWASKQGAKLSVLMHFSRIVGGLENDLGIVFDNVLAVKWEEESFGLITSPDDLPTCSNQRFNTWTHPTLIIQDSNCAREYADRKYAKDDRSAGRIVHYFLLSLNDLLHVLAESEPISTWVAPSDA